MDLIPSFQIDHTRLQPGIYVSRVDEVGGDFVTTFDLRMKRPNIDPTVSPAAMHTIEHLVATCLRNDPAWRDRIVYFGPMGCLTGCYLLVKGRPTPEEILPPVKAAYEFCAAYEGDVPGATPDGCGNWTLHDLAGAKTEAKRYADLLGADPCFVYPAGNRN